LLESMQRILIDLSLKNNKQVYLHGLIDFYTNIN
jgi:hypothetical protein